VTPRKEEVEAKAGAATSTDSDRVDSPSPAVINSRDTRLVAVALLCGLVLRFGVALVSQNPDGLTLAWGSALVATGHANPYAEVVSHPEHDPIPVDEISAVSLAQGPIGVVVGAVPMAIAKAIGLIHLGDQPDGTAFEQGELFAYKVSFLVPEALIVAALWAGAAAVIGGDRERLASRRRQLMVVWAANPLIVFTWGQGMPDTWTVAVMCWAAVLMGPLAERAEPHRRLWLYRAAALLIPIGAFGTKMMPIVMLVPLAVIVARDGELGRGRWSVAAAGTLGLVVGAAPYVVSQAVRVNVLDRFELNMLNSRDGIPTLHAMPNAQWSLLLAIVATLWFVSRPEPRRALVVWLAIALITVATMSSIIPHLMFWVGAAILVIGLLRPVAALAMTAAAGLMVLWHLITYTWLGNLVVAGLEGTGTVAGQPSQWVAQHVPLTPTVGGAITSLWIVVALGAVWVLARRVPLSVSPRAWKAVAVAGPLGLIAGLGLNITLAEAQGPTAWEFGSGGQPVAFGLSRDDPWTSPVIDSGSQANTVMFSVDKRTHANPDEIVVEIIDRQDNVLASGSVPVWVAEPASEKVSATVTLSRRVDVEGVRVRFSRRKVGSAEEVPVILAGAIGAAGSAGAETVSPREDANTSTTTTVAANESQELEVVPAGESSTNEADSADSATATTVPEDAGASGATGVTPGAEVTAEPRITGPIFRLRDDRVGRVPGLVLGRLLGPAGWAAWFAAVVLAAAGAWLLTRRVQPDPGR
jgi:hypothetical protein